MKTWTVLFTFALAVLLASPSCKKEVEPDDGGFYAAQLTPYNFSYPNYFPVIEDIPENPMTVEGVELGRRLYYDSILHPNHAMACASCHSQSDGFSDPTVNSMPHANLAWQTAYLWNGKIEGTLEDIALFEVEEFFNTNVSDLQNDPYYADQFLTVFNVNTITSSEVAKALAQFFKSLVSGNSRFDQYLRSEVQLTPSELSGYIVFSTEKGDCFHCHSMPMFFDNDFHNIGIDSVFSGVEQGRYNVTGINADMGKFKTPSLRNVELTAPYMHDGRFQTLEEVVEHYNSGVALSSTLDPIMTKPGKEFGLELTPQEKADLVAFLKTLTDQQYITNPVHSSPF